jgi:NADH:ubiquinone oxidoreductase subunit 6 (subunit J)
MQLCAQAVIPLFGFVMVAASTWIYRRRRDWRSLLFLVGMVLVAGWCLLISAVIAGVVPLMTIGSAQ